MFERAGITNQNGVSTVGAYDQTEVEPEIFELLKVAWDLNAFKQTFTDANLDVAKLPLGTLT